MGSGIPPDIAAANFCSIAGQEVVERLAGSALDQLGGHSSQYATGPVRNILHRYEKASEGGWWGSGVQLETCPTTDMTTSTRAEWGCFKPDTPRDGWKKDDQGQWRKSGRVIKYEHPIRVPTGLFVPEVPRQPNLWANINKKHEVDGSLPPIIITEGIKKACCLSSEYAAVGLPGITQWNKPKTQELIPQLKALALPGRHFLIAFDQDLKPKTKKAVETEIEKLAAALKRYKCTVSVIEWDPKQGKGVDDFIVSQGMDAFRQAFSRAPRFEVWALRRRQTLSIAPDWIAPPEQQYLEPDEDSQVPIPGSTKLVLVKAPKGVGKTELIARLTKEANAAGQRVLLLSHRIQLTQQLGDRLGILSIYEARQKEVVEASAEIALTGLSLCVQSMHPASQARFRAEDWADSLVVVDEADQVVWELLDSATCRSHRPLIFQQLRSLVECVLNPESEGRMVLADADLSDFSVNFIRSMSKRSELSPWLAFSDFQPRGFDVVPYKKSVEWLFSAEEAIERGERLDVITDSQRHKSRCSTTALESRWRQKYPHLKILRIDSETLHREDHPAFGVARDINEIAKEYDVIIRSPALESGVSLDVKGHFDAVYGHFAGVLSVPSVCQSLSRLREPVPRHVFVAEYGLTRIGGGETWWKSLARSQNKHVKTALRLIFEAGCEDLDSDFCMEATIAWAKMAARLNTGMNAYRDCTLDSLQREGNTLLRFYESPPDPDSTARIVITTKELKVQRHERLADLADKVLSASSLTEAQLDKLESAGSCPSEKQFHSLEKSKLQNRYQADELTKDLFMLDQQGWADRIRLHYYLGLGRQHLNDRDKARVNALLENNPGNQVWGPDIESSTLAVKIAALEVFKVPSILELKGEKVTQRTPQLVELASVAKEHIPEIRRVLGFSVSQKDSNMEVARKFLNQVGFKLDYIERQGKRGEQVRVYSIVQNDEAVFRFSKEKGDDIIYRYDRNAVFENWLKRDSAAKAQPAEPVIHKADDFVSCDTVATDGNIVTSSSSLADYGNPEPKPFLNHGLSAPHKEQGGEGEEAKLASHLEIAAPTAASALLAPEVEEGARGKLTPLEKACLSVISEPGCYHNGMLKEVLTRIGVDGVARLWQYVPQLMQQVVSGLARHDEWTAKAVQIAAQSVG